MKIQRIIILAIVFFALSHCKKNSDEPYSNIDIVMDNAQAALYFHTVFCEAEYAWAFADINDYEDITVDDPKRKLKYWHSSEEKTNDTVTIEYNDLVLKNHLSLTGTIIVSFDNDSSYRKNQKKANLLLSDFSINGQKVVGEASITYRVTTNNPNDQYVYTLLNGSAIHETGTSAMLISCVISNGQYERIEGNETTAQNDDDVWAFSGAMTGMLHDDPNLKYTNTVTPTLLVNGENIDAKVYYNANCITASQGNSQIKIAKRPDIIYAYGCSELYFESTTHHIR